MKISCSEVESYEVWHIGLGIQLNCIIKKEILAHLKKETNSGSIEEYMNGFINIGL